MKHSALEQLAQSARPAVDRPQRGSFEEFLVRDARVPVGGGEHGPYSFEGREAIRGIVRRIDAILGGRKSEVARQKSEVGGQRSEVTAEPLADSLLGIAGGAQWGKTILELNLAAYLTSQRWLACGLFLPDENLVQGIVDTKFRPDVVDQIPWFAEMTQIGKAVNRSGKTANRKGAFLVTDGRRKTSGMVLGLQKVPTSFTFDVTLQDEVDDIPEKNAKFVKGRRTASKLRFDVRIGTQRVHGRGQNKVWKDGSQGVVILGPMDSTAKDAKDAKKAEGMDCAGGRRAESEISERGDGSTVFLALPPTSAIPQPGGEAAELPACSGGLRPSIAPGNSAFPEPGGEITELPAGWVNPEENFPGIVRCQVGEVMRADDPRLTWAGDFKRDGDEAAVATHSPEARYYLAHPETGAPLDRSHPLWLHRAPGKFEQRNYTYRASQLGFDAIGLSQIVGQFQLAVNDPDEMTVFRCDVLALPQSTAQAVTPAVLERARNVEPFDIRTQRAEGRAVYGGLDTGDRCWFLTREVESAERKRVIFAAGIPAGDMVTRGISLFHQLGMTCLFIDQRPLVSQARALALELNGLNAITHWPAPPEGNTFTTLDSGLTWDGNSGRWGNLKCAVVRFDKKSIGAGIEQGVDVFEEDGQTKFVPLIRCNRYETIDRVVREFLTPAESVVEIVNGLVREMPAMLLPRMTTPVAQTLEEHIVTGSERVKEKDGSPGDYVDGVANHLLLADGYSALAEIVAGRSPTNTTQKMIPFSKLSRWNRNDRCCLGA